MLSSLRIALIGAGLVAGAAMALADDAPPAGLRTGRAALPMPESVLDRVSRAHRAVVARPAEAAPMRPAAVPDSVATRTVRTVPLLPAAEPAAAIPPPPALPEPRAENLPARAKADTRRKPKVRSRRATPGQAGGGSGGAVADAARSAVPQWFGACESGSCQRRADEQDAPAPR